ncbi:MAG: NUDIX hydrolase [Chlorobi bacterium]|nr:NUDIX hydrolase [Chlorobiota bacterium]
MPEENKWLKWAREIQSLAQTGLAFAPNHYEIERNNRLLGIAAEIVSEYALLDKKKTAKIFMEQPGYATPKIDVRAAVVKNNQLLLVKEITDKKWSTPGGWADVGDMPAEVAIRETKEESGYDVKPIKVIGVFDANRNGRPMEFFHAFKIVFLCKLTGGEARVSNETEDVRFFDFDKLPPLSENRTNEKHISEILAHLKDVTRMTFFE